MFGIEHSDGAVEPGILEQAEGGIIYFDEIGDLPAESQSKLIRMLIEQRYKRVGGNSPRNADVRVISASSKNLEQEIAAGRFREELFHRLNVVPITVPGLEKRREDIPLLADYFIDELHAVDGHPKRVLSPDAATMLQSSPWPGNLRQLRNTIERILILGDTSPEISQDEIPSDAQRADKDDTSVILAGSLATMSLREARELFEREYLLTQINRFGGNISRTAHFVGMERSALHRKLKSLGMVTSNRKGAASAD